jgi:uncharacterized linocin/CFP29 family protein
MPKNKASRFSLAGEPTGALRGLQSALVSCRSIDELRSLAPMPKDAQEMIDAAVVKVGLDRLSVVADVMAEGLTYGLPDPLSTMELYWEKESKTGHAQRTMLPGARGERQLADRSGVRVPIYATTDDFSLNVRTLRASERAGAPLDTSMVEQATRRVNEAIEDAMINGAGITVGGNDAPGLMNQTNINTQVYTGSNPAWDHTSKTGAEILADVLLMIDALQADRKFGPYNLYIPTEYGNAINNDFKAASDKTIRQRLEEIVVGGRPLRIREADALTDDYTLLVQMTSDVVDVVVGQEPTVVSWEDGPGWERMFVVLAFMIPRVKDDYDGNSGVCRGYTS